MNHQSIPTDRAERKVFWQDCVQKYRSSEATSAAQFCREQGLPYPTFMTWLNKLEPKPAKPEQPKSFIRIPATREKSTSIVCRLPNGLELSWDIKVPVNEVKTVIQEVSQL